MPPGLPPWSLLCAGIGAAVVLGWLVAGPADRRLTALAPLAGLASLLALLVGLLGAAGAQSVGGAAAAVVAVSLLPVGVALAGLLASRIAAAAPSPRVPQPPSTPATPDTPRKPSAAPSPPASDDDELTAAVRQLALSQREHAERIEDALSPLVPAIQVASEASQSLRDEMVRLTAEQHELQGLLSGWREQQAPTLEVLSEAGGQMQQLGGDVAQLMRLVVANQQLTVDGLESACRELTAAGQTLQTAAAEWGGLVRSGLADSREFSRQAIEALLAGLERSPDELTGLPDAARDAMAEADATEARLRAAAAELTTVVDGLQANFEALTTRLTEQLRTAVNAVDATALAGLKSSLDSLQGTTTQLSASLGKLDPAFGSLAQLGSLTEALTALRAALESRVTPTGWSWPAKLFGTLVLIYVLAMLTLASGLTERW